MNGLSEADRYEAHNESRYAQLPPKWGSVECQYAAYTETLQHILYILLFLLQWEKSFSQQSHGVVVL